MEAVRQYVRERIAIEDHGFVTRCWIWQLSLNSSGYGQGHPPGGPIEQAHRFSYRAFVGPIPTGLHLDHLCRVRDCCNPDHLEPVTPAENNRRALPYMAWRKQTHCKRGHEFTQDNTLRSTSGRRCRTCYNEWQRSRANAPRTKPVDNPHSHCEKGHELTPENTIVWKNARRCRVCNIAWRAEHDDHRARFRMAKQRKMAAARNERGEGCNRQRPTQKDNIARRHGGSR
jgi:hypothetical protein